jgi:hypothetical protein
MMEERCHATTQNRFYPDMSNVNKNITVEAKLISPPTYIGLHIKYTLTSSEFSEILTFSFEKSSNTKFHENMSIGSRVVARGRTDGRT